MTSQSIILNLNKEFASSQAENFLQPVSQAYDVGKEAEVALYGANLTRKPILNEQKPGVSDNFTEVSIQFASMPDVAQVNEFLAGTVVDATKVPYYATGLPNPKSFPEVGSYARDEICDFLAADFNTNITQECNGTRMQSVEKNDISINGKAVVLQIPYSVAFEKENFYFGLQGSNMLYADTTATNFQLNCNLPCNCQIETYDNTEEVNTGDILRNEVTGGDFDQILEIRANVAVDKTNYSSFSHINSSPIFPLLTQNKLSQLDTYTNGCNQCFFEYEVNLDDTQTDNTYDVITGFTNTYLQSQWASSNTPALNSIKPVSFDNIANYPSVFVGIRHYHKIDSSNVTHSFLEVFCPNEISTRCDYLNDSNPLSNVFTENLGRLALVNLNNTNMNGLTVGYRFVKHKNQRGAGYQQLLSTPSDANEELVLFSNTYSIQVYTRDSEGEVVVYDSTSHSFYLPGNLLEDGFLINGAISQRAPAERCNLGFMPYMFVNKAETDEGISNPRGNWICYMDNTKGDFVYKQGAQQYNILVTSPSLEQALGQSQLEQNPIVINRKSTADKFEFKGDNRLKYDPNAFPRFRAEAGLTKMYSDNTQYNIELNLPVKAYNTTRTNKNNIGQKRTIVYKTEPVIEGESHEIQSVFINKNIQPNSLKFLTLNNTEPLNLNNMNIQIRRNHNNELATELEDASVEILIKSK